MQLIDMQDYSPAARRYWWTVMVLGVWALTYAISKVGQFEGMLLLFVQMAPERLEKIQT